MEERNEVVKLYGIINDKNAEIKRLQQENDTLKERLKMFVSRKKIRTVYKELGKILDADKDPYVLEQELKQREDI